MPIRVIPWQRDALLFDTASKCLRNMASLLLCAFV